MSETRKNHLTIDGGQGKEDDHVASYKPIPETDADFRTSKASLHKSREKVSADGAEEKLLQKEEEAKIITRVDMADAKYVVGDHRNGDAKIELDANKRQFTGLTKEELMKYAEDPFWVRLRWFMFVLFWALWLCMLAGAIVIIVRAPKCAAPPPRTWYEKGPLIEMSSVEDLREVAVDLEPLDSSQVAGVFTFACKNTYDVLTETNCIDQFKELLVKTKKAGIRVIVDLTANFVEKTHKWFQDSENNIAPYKDYFIWAKSTEFDPTTGDPEPPNNWRSLMDQPMWNYSTVRKEFYLHHFADDQPDLNFDNVEVVRHFDDIIKTWMQAGADGIRLLNVRELFVDLSKGFSELDNPFSGVPGADQTQYKFYKPLYTSDQPRLDPLLAHWSNITRTEADEAVFTIAEDKDDKSRPELFRLERDTSSLHPPQARPIDVQDPASAIALLNKTISGGRWPAVQLIVDSAGVDDGELAAFAMLLPVTPILDITQLHKEDNETSSSESLSHAISLRDQDSIQHGLHMLAAVPVNNSTDTMIACARIKKGQTGYVGVYNPYADAGHANLTSISWLPSSLSVHRVSRQVHLLTNYTTNLAVYADSVLVPAKSSLILSFVPKIATEE